MQIFKHWNPLQWNKYQTSQGHFTLQLFSHFVHISQGIQKSKRNVLNSSTDTLYDQMLEIIYGLKWSKSSEEFLNTCRISKYSYVILQQTAASRRGGKTPHAIKLLKKNLSTLQTLSPSTEAHITVTLPKRHKRYIHWIQLYPTGLHCTQF